MFSFNQFVLADYQITSFWQFLSFVKGDVHFNFPDVLYVQKILFIVKC